MTPVMTTVDNLENKMDSVFQEITTVRQPLSMSALGTVPVQAAPAPVPAAGQLWVAQRERLHSTALPEARNNQLDLLTVFLFDQESKHKWLENAP